ncbi:MAG: hypothetical protein V1714_05685 [Pseudomonadota bacterium]
MDIEIYRVWFDYLKLSKPYKSLCGFIRKGKIPPKKYLPPYIGLLRGIILDKVEQEKDYPGHIWETYRVFRDIHQETFESFWEKKKDYFKLFSKDKGVYDLRKTLLFHAESFKAGFLRGQGREPAIDDFVRYLSNYLPDTLFLSIDLLSGATASELSKKVTEHIKNGKAAIKGTYDHFHLLSCRNKRPTPKVHLKDLKHYLEVYRHYQDGLKPKGILKKLTPEADYIPQDSVEISRDRLFAERIISNAEKGYFPGNYKNPPEK